MQKLIFLVSVLLVLAAVVTDAVPDRKLPGERKGKVRIKYRGDTPRKDGIRIKFPETLDLEIEDLTNKDKLKVKAKRVPVTQTSLSLLGSDNSTTDIRFESAAMYVGNNSTFMITAAKNPNGSFKSKLIGRVRKGGRRSWINDDTVTSWDEFALEKNWEEVLEILSINSTTEQNPSGRKKRATSIPTVFDYDPMNVVELVIMVDQQWLTWFKLRNPTDAGALKEAALYVTMLLTEVNAIYRTVSDSTAGQMELVVFGVKLLYPAGSQEWPFLSSTAGVLQTTESCGTGCIPLLTTLKTFLDNHWASLPQFDHLAFLSGYDIANAAGSGLLGIAYSNTVCEQDGYRSYKISVTEDFKHDAVFIFAHELGHALGARHDGFDTAIACPPSGYIMAAYAESPTAASENTFWTFSNCSVNGFISHLAAMRDAGRDCLSSGSTNATDEAFRSQFCSGPRGARYSLDEQCFYESSATKYAFDANCNPLPTRPDGVTKMAPINACWDDRLVACSSQNTPGTCNDTASNGTAIFHVADGTPCQGSDPNLDYVCFNGDCLLTPDVCSGWNSTSSVPTGDIYPCACTNLTDTDRATCCSFKPIRPCCNGCRTVGKRCVA